MTKDESLKIIENGDGFYVQQFIKSNGKFELLQVYGPFSRKGAKRFKQMTPDRRKKFRKRLAINRIKSGNCLDCGQKKSRAEMTFDHYRGVKKFDIASGPRMSWLQLSNEIEKCELVCRICHNIREFFRGRFKLKRVNDLSELLSRYL